MPSPIARPSWQDHLSIALLSVSAMLLQIALTRVLSVVAWYHWAFLLISIVMLGMGAPGVWFALDRRPQRWLPALLLLAGLGAPLGITGILRAADLMREPGILWYSCCMLPPLLGIGGAVCLLLMRAEGPALGRMYGVDLLGACAAAAVVIPLMNTVPSPHLVAACGLPPLVALMLRRGVWVLVGGLAAATVVAALAVGTPFRITTTKSYDERAVVPIAERWTATARLTVFDEKFWFLQPQAKGFTWGRGTKYPDGAGVQQYWLEQDASAGTPLTRFDGDLEKLRYLLFDVTTAAHQLRPPKTVAVIGGGGGRDVLSALVAGATWVDAIELNGGTVDLVSRQFGELTGDVYHRPGVHARVSEGRSWLTHTDQRYDLIQISLIDSWAASAAGAFALAENNLYTVEAFRLFADRLNDDGVLSVSRWTWELPRLLVLARQHLLDRGVADPASCIAISTAQAVANVMIRRRPFTPAEIERMRAVADERGFEMLHPRPPGKRADEAVERVLREGDAGYSEHGFDLSPPTDDRPYFFHVLSPFRRWTKAEADAYGAFRANVDATLVLQKAMLSVSFAALLLFFLPFVLRRLRSAGPGDEPWRGTLFFAAIGAGFMAVENALIQRFVLYLGHPSYAMTVVLATLLLGMGLGAMLAPRVALQRMQRLGGVVALLLAAQTLLLPAVFATTLGLPLPLRIAVAAALLLPTGAALGLFFPLGMLRFGDRHKAWFWAVNGFCGVAASVLSLAASMEFGFATVGLIGAFVYATAWFALRPGARAAATA